MEQPFADGSWPFTEHSRRFSVDGFRWHAQIVGSGPVVLLLHGLGASSHSFRELMPRLASRFTIVAPDLPGHAFTEVPRGFKSGITTMATAVGRLLEELEVEPLVAVGHSAGAAVTARMMLDGAITPRLFVGLAAALVPFRGFARVVFPRTARLLSAASKLVPLRVGKESVERLLQQTGSSLDREGVEHYQRLSERPQHVAAALSMMSNWDLAPTFAALSEIRTSSLLVAGEHDGAIPIAQQRLLAARLPRARLVVLDRAGHLLHEERPAAVARLIRNSVSAVCSDAEAWSGESQHAVCP
jgi:magnesium chelatase accessory protein